MGGYVSKGDSPVTRGVPETCSSQEIRHNSSSLLLPRSHPVNVMMWSTLNRNPNPPPECWPPHQAGLALPQTSLSTWEAWTHQDLLQLRWLPQPLAVTWVLRYEKL